MKKLNQEKFNELVELHWINTLEWQDKILKELKKMMLETALEWELWYELGYKKWAKRKTIENETENKNYRNGYSSKQVLTSDWPIENSVPRDRNGEFEPMIVEKGSNDISDIEQKIIRMYARGTSNKEIYVEFPGNPLFPCLPELPTPFTPVIYNLFSSIESIFLFNLSSTCLPAISASRAKRKCSVLGEVTITKSISGSSMMPLPSGTTAVTG